MYLGREEPRKVIMYRGVFAFLGSLRSFSMWIALTGRSSSRISGKEQSFRDGAYILPLIVWSNMAIENWMG